MKTPKLLVLAYTSKTYDTKFSNPRIFFERPDLSRKHLCLDTWVHRLKNIGIETIFFDGDNSELLFDEKSQTLHLLESDSYDYCQDGDKISKMFIRLQSAIKWSLENKDFDYILRVDDGTYVNSYILEKYLNEFVNGKHMVFSGLGGGGGIFFSKETCKELSSYDIRKNIENELDIYEDHLIIKILEEKKIACIGDTIMSCFYNLGEENLTIHYATGKRMYYADFVISNYYKNQKFLRKIIINNNFKEHGREKLSTNLPVWYGLDRDKNNWEYYGNYDRNLVEINNNFYGNEVIDKLCLFYNHNYTEELIGIDKYILKFQRSIVPTGSILVLLNTKNKNSINYVEEKEFISILDKIKILNIDFEVLQEIKYKEYLEAEYVDENDFGTIIKINKN